jgi:hypothetical protein
MNVVKELMGPIAVLSIVALAACSSGHPHTALDQTSTTKRPTETASTTTTVSVTTTSIRPAVTTPTTRISAPTVSSVFYRAPPTRPPASVATAAPITAVAPPRPILLPPCKDGTTRIVSGKKETCSRGYWFFDAGPIIPITTTTTSSFLPTIPERP